MVQIESDKKLWKSNRDELTSYTPPIGTATTMIDDTVEYRYKIYRHKQLNTNKANTFFMSMRKCDMGTSAREPSMIGSTSLNITPDQDKQLLIKVGSISKVTQTLVEYFCSE